MRPSSRTALAAVMACCAATTNVALAAELFFDFNRNVQGQNLQPSLFLFGNSGQSANVSNLAGFNQTVTLSPQGFFNLPIPLSAQQSGTGVRNTGFQVASSDPIAGYFINRSSFSTDMTYLLDSGALGKEYTVASIGQGFGEGSQVAIHAVQNGTNVTFTPVGGAPISVTLNAGETYKYAGGVVDLTGSTIVADRNVAVFSGHECGQVPPGTTFCDTLLEQAIPNDKLSKSYLLTASQGADSASTRSDLVRVIAVTDGTRVDRDGVTVATINKGQFYEFSLSQNSGTRIDASAPVAAAQYLKGGQGQSTDPAMSYVPGADTWLKSYRLSTPTGSAAFNVNYASVVLKTADLASLALNGLAVSTVGFSPIGSTGFSRGSIGLPLGLFNLSANSEFLLMLGGGSQADSYFTYGGSTFAPGISPPQPPPNGVPEPVTLGLLVLALAALGTARARIGRT